MFYIGGDTRLSLTLNKCHQLKMTFLTSSLYLSLCLSGGKNNLLISGNLAIIELTLISESAITAERN